ncbi:MAG TPA: rod shape-determining protein MreD [Candidatus Bathyarchaeia archaeon]|nr:rod shape-determining protein MreD [Candidatus Bathyarchaeia archaeon]
MSFTVLILITFVMLLVQTTLIPFDWALVLVLSEALLAKDKEIAWLAFVTGLLLDLFLGKPWGLSSAALLIIAFLVFSVRRYLLTRKLIVVYMIAFFGEFFFNYLLFRSFNLLRAGFFAMVFSLVYFFFSAKEIKDNQELKLKI